MDIESHEVCPNSTRIIILDKQIVEMRHLTLFTASATLRVRTRAHRLPHRATAARRPAARPSRETTPHRRLPVLWRTDKKTATPVTRLASQPSATPD
jgi:hypothetical protein